MSGVESDVQRDAPCRRREVNEQRDTVPGLFADIKSGIVNKYICQKTN